jgi:histone H3/H4|tara:strand:+ start:287 stop:508 length:222 start_codon:yes stop_codon:yes gene_type:complete
MSEYELGLAAIYRIIKKAGAQRIGDDAVEELQRSLEKTGIEISQKAIEYSNHAGRKTIKSSDIKLALKSIKLE